MSDPPPEADGSGPPPGWSPRMPLAELAWRAGRSLSRAERRALALRLLEGEAEEITFRRNGTRWTAFAWDRMISEPVFMTGDFQAREVEAVLAWMARHGRVAPPRDVIVDVGANIGTSTVPFAQARPDCRVVAIEPVPDVFAVLCRNVADNGLAGRVTCVEAAISADGRDRVEMILPAGHGGGGEIRCPDRPPSFAGRLAVRGVVEVRAAGLAALLQAHGVAPERVAFVWSDSQGSETDVIASGDALWAASVPLFTELDPRTWVGFDRVHAFLAAARRHFGAFVGAEALISGGAMPPAPSRRPPPAPSCRARAHRSRAWAIRPGSTATATASSAPSARVFPRRPSTSVSWRSTAPGASGTCRPAAAAAPASRPGRSGRVDAG